MYVSDAITKTSSVFFFIGVVYIDNLSNFVGHFFLFSLLQFVDASQRLGAHDTTTPVTTDLKNTKVKVEWRSKIDGFMQDCSNSIANALDYCSLALSHTYGVGNWDFPMKNKDLLNLVTQNQGIKSPPPPTTTKGTGSLYDVGWMLDVDIFLLLWNVQVTW